MILRYRYAREILNQTMNSVWVVTENRGGVELNILKITETKELAEKYVKDRFSLYFEDHYEWVVSTDQPDLKVWADVEKDEFAECEEPQDYFDDHLGCTFLVIEKWSVSKG